MRLEHWLYTLPLRLRSLFRGSAADRDLDDEMQYHVERLTEENIAKGMSAEEARFAALRAMEGLTQNKEKARDTRRIGGILNFGRDLRYALRGLRKNPGFSAIAIITLALGIGANTAIFSVVNAMLLRPLPFPEPDRLVRLWESAPDSHAKNVVNPYNFLDWREHTHVFEDMAAVTGGTTNLTDSGSSVALPGLEVSPGYFSILRVNPYLGRTFLPEDGTRGHSAKVILSYGLWQERFGGDRNIIGKVLNVNGAPHVVVGVIPPGFAFPRNRAEIWAPLPIDRSDAWLRGRYLTVVARLKPGVTMAQAQQDMEAAARVTAQLRPDFDRGWGAMAIPALADVTQGLSKSLWVLLGAVGFLLLIACVNVANLLLMRGTGRLREIAVRQSLGATRSRIIQQLLAESLILAGMALLVGLALAKVSLRGLLAFIPPTAPLPRSEPITLDGYVLAFTIVVSFFTTLIFGLMPSLHLSRVNPLEALKTGSLQAAGGHRGLQRGLVIVEISLAIVLTIAAGLMSRSLQRLMAVDPGFETQHVLTMRMLTSPAKYRDDRKRSQYMENLVTAVDALPGVERAGTVHFLPLQDHISASCFEKGSKPPTPSSSPVANFLVVSPGYFSTMRMRLLDGRDFNAHDRLGSPTVILVNQAFVRRFLPNEDPMGQHFSLCWTESMPNPAEVIGVVTDARQAGLSTHPEPTIFVSNVQSPMYFAALVVRAHGEPKQILSSVESAIHRVDPEQAISGIETLEDVVSDSVSQPRFQTVLLMAFAVVALALCTIGVYGVISYSVERRTREIGILMALGADRAGVVRLIVREALILAGTGLIIGLLAALAVTRLLSSLLYEISPSDPFTMVTVSLVIMASAMIASFLPTRRATKVHPMSALRYE
jgi:putative ABC transport system permease protein